MNEIPEIDWSKIPGVKAEEESDALPKKVVVAKPAREEPAPERTAQDNSSRGEQSRGELSRGEPSRGESSRGRSGSETNEQGMVQREQEALEKIAPKSIEVASVQAASSAGVSTAPNNEFLFNKVKDLESAAAPNPNYHPGAGETSVKTSGMDYDHIYIGGIEYTPGENTEGYDFLQIGADGSSSWIVAMISPMPTGYEIYNIRKNHIHITGATAGNI